MELDWIWIGGTSYPIGYTSYRVDILRIVERTTYGGHTAYGGTYCVRWIPLKEVPCTLFVASKICLSGRELVIIKNRLECKYITNILV
jgi:hypothetical protein